MPSRVFRVSGEQLVDFFRQDAEKMELRSVIAEHLLSQARACYIDLHRATARERYELLLQRCPVIVEHLALQDLASFLRPVGSKRQSRAPERHSQDHQHDPKGYHFRQGLATDFTKQQ